MIDDLWTSKGPTPAELRDIDRLGKRRCIFEAITPTDEAEAHVKARALALLEDMEECLCEEGSGARFLAEGWRELDELELRLAQTPPDADVVLLAEHQTDTCRTDKSPSIQGGTDLITTSIDIMRSVAEHSAANPVPPDPDAENARPWLPDLMPRITRVVAALIGDGVVNNTVLRVVAQALTTLLPLLDGDSEPAGPSPVPERRPEGDARIDILRQERAARWRERAETREQVADRARPDIPPTTRVAEGVVASLFGPAADAWNDLLDLVSEALETFIAFRDAEGVSACLEILDLLAEAFGLDLPEAA